MPVTRSKSKSPEPRPPPQTSTANQRKRQSAAPTGDVAADQSDALAILSAAATVPGPTTTDSLVDDRVDEIAARIEATRKKREDLEAEIARDQAALQLLRDHPRGAEHRNRVRMSRSGVSSASEWLLRRWATTDELFTTAPQLGTGHVKSVEGSLVGP